MSQRPPASRPASRSPPDGQKIILPSVQLRDDPQQGGRQPERQQQPEPEGRGFPPRLQPSPQHARLVQPAPSREDWRSSGGTRHFAVHSILNQPEPERSASSGRRLSGPPTESPRSAVGPPPFGASPVGHPSHMFPGQQSSSNTPTGEYPPSYPPQRRILTPRSPSRNLSSSGRPPGRGTINAQQSPFLPSGDRPHMGEYVPPGPSDIQPRPTPPAQFQQQQSYGFPPTASTPNIAPRRDDRRESGPGMQAPGRTPLSQSASPSISASSQNMSSSQTSPASFFPSKSGAPPTSASYFPGQSFSSIQTGGGMSYQGQSGEPAGPYSAPTPQTGSSLHSSSAGSSRQASASDPIQVLTITTSEGQFINVPVDVHQASRLADEKRARNAGASARFRQRRKEKEKEANTNIEKLQAQTRELERKFREMEQDRDYYRSERDRYREVLAQTPGMGHLARGPPSPQSMRASSFPGSIGGSMGGGGFMGGPPGPPPQRGFQAAESGPGPERPARRRRTDTQGEFSSMAYTLPPSTTLPPVHAPNYAPSHGPPPHLPPLRMENPAATHPPPPNMPAATTAGPQPPYDPYARGPYERGWAGDGRQQ
jgi:hypothetical protein